MLDPKSYQDCEAIFYGSRRRKLANNTTLWASEDCEPEFFEITLHSTTVFMFYRDGSFELNSGGWKTVTTKERLNRYLPDGWRVYQLKFEWWLADVRNGWASEVKYEFKDGMRVSADGVVS